MKNFKFDEGDLWLGDCLEVMKTLPDNSIDLIFGSPPYEEARLYLEEGKNLGIARCTEDWVNWMIDIYKESLRVCKGLVAYVVGHGHGAYSWSAAPALLCAELIKHKINLRSPCLYKRQGVPGSGAEDWLRADFEWIICATKGGPLPWADSTACGKPPEHGPGGVLSNRNKDGSRVNDLVKKEGISRRAAADKLGIKLGYGTSGGRNGDMKTEQLYLPPEISNPGNIIDCGVVGGGNMGSNITHLNEAPFPDKLANFFVRSFCPVGGIVCDPFTGSGTTVGEAVKTGRKFIGIDLRMSQIKLSKRRIDQSRIKKGFGVDLS